jgi:hypothetical protein
MADGGGKLSFISVSLKLVRPFVGQCRVWAMVVSGSRPRHNGSHVCCSCVLARPCAVCLGKAIYIWLLCLTTTFQSGNMTDPSYYLMAQNQLMLPVDPVSVFVLICMTVGSFHCRS